MRLPYSPITESNAEAYASCKYHDREHIAVQSFLFERRKTRAPNAKYYIIITINVRANPLALSGGRLSSIIKLKCEMIKLFSSQVHFFVDESQSHNLFFLC